MQAVFSLFTPIVLQYYAGTRKLILYNRVIIIYVYLSLMLQLEMILSTCIVLGSFIFNNSAACMSKSKC